jgi:hypothetical protein
LDIKAFVEYLDKLPSLSVSDNVQAVYDGVQGYTSPYIMTMINKAVSNLGAGEVYLEIGVFRGKTLIGALVGNDAKAIAVDSFTSEWAMNTMTPNPGSFVVDNMLKFGVSERVTFLELDLQDFFAGKIDEKVGVYFFDAYSHDLSVCNAGLEMVVPFLADSAVIFVDEASSIEMWHAIVNFCHNHEKETVMLFYISTPNFPFYSDANWFNGLAAIGWRRIKEGEVRSGTIIK